jgi:hypothetical protein
MAVPLTPAEFAGASADVPVTLRISKRLQMSIDTQKIIEEFKRGPADTGSPEVQVDVVVRAYRNAD